MSPACPTAAGRAHTLHFVFGDKRRRLNREFFIVEPDLATAIIDLVALKEETLTDQDQAITPEERTEIDQIKTIKARVTLASLGLSPGAILTFSKDPAITCQVSGPRSVLFRGESHSVSAAALTAIRELGYAWPTVNGFEYWMADGVKLSELRSAGAAAELATHICAHFPHLHTTASTTLP